LAESKKNIDFFGLVLVLDVVDNLWCHFGPSLLFSIRFRKCDYQKHFKDNKEKLRRGAI
jgi:hypothetical protein